MQGNFQRRYKRFFADFLTPGGEVLTAHCANTGSMRTCYEEGAPCLLTSNDNPRRKLKYTWQAIHMPDGWVGINTGLANALVEEAIATEVIRELNGYAEISREQRYGDRARVDFLLRDPGRSMCFVEVKNVTLLMQPGVAGFPDAVTARGVKHLENLSAMKKAGHRAVLLYCVQRASVTRVKAARIFDPTYANALHKAVNHGLEVYAYAANITPETVTLERAIPVDI